MYSVNVKIQSADSVLLQWYVTDWSDTSRGVFWNHKGGSVALNVLVNGLVTLCTQTGGFSFTR